MEQLARRVTNKIPNQLLGNVLVHGESDQELDLGSKHLEQLVRLQTNQ